MLKYAAFPWPWRAYPLYFVRGYTSAAGRGLSVPVTLMVLPRGGLGVLR
jgi:hypothetical protein